MSCLFCIDPAVDQKYGSHSDERMEAARVAMGMAAKFALFGVVGVVTAGVVSGREGGRAMMPGAPASGTRAESGPGASTIGGSANGDATGIPRSAGHRLSSVPVLHTFGRSSAFVTFRPEAADGSTFTCGSDSTQKV